MVGRRENSVIYSLSATAVKKANSTKRVIQKELRKEMGTVFPPMRQLDVED